MNDNLHEIEAALNSLVEAVRFDRPGRSETLGKGALELVSGRIQDRCRNEQAPGGGRWAPNKEWAAKNKLKQGKPVGVLGDVSEDSMLAARHIDGKRTVAAERAMMEYGDGSEFAERKAEWFSNGSVVQTAGTEPSGAKNQASRPFYELDQSDEAALDSYFKDNFDAVVIREGGNG